MDNSILYQGIFTSDGGVRDIALRGDVTWFKTYNITTLAAAGAGTGVEFMWMDGLADGSAIEYKKTAVTNAIAPSVITSGGFTRIEVKEPVLGALNSTVTGISNAAIPIVSATSTAGLVAGDIVRFVDVTGAQQFGGIDFEIDTVVANTSFRLPYAPQIVAGTTGSFYPVKVGYTFIPRPRYISAITKAANAVVTTTVKHNYVDGQKVRLEVPAAYGMKQAHGLVATVINTTDSTVTLDINSSAFTTFAWPLTADLPFTPARIVPFGEAAQVPYQNMLDDSVENIGSIVMQLAAGADSPAGVNNDVIYWVAGRSFEK